MLVFGTPFTFLLVWLREVVAINDIAVLFTVIIIVVLLLFL